MTIRSEEDYLYHVVENLAREDAAVLKERDKSYGSSWKKRGGVGAFMMLARKWDRIENQTMKQAWDIFQCIMKDPSSNGILDDIRDLRRYLLLVEAEMALRGMGSKAHDAKEEIKNTANAWRSTNGTHANGLKMLGSEGFNGA